VYMGMRKDTNYKGEVRWGGEARHSPFDPPTII